MKPPQESRSGASSSGGSGTSLTTRSGATPTMDRDDVTRLVRQPLRATFLAGIEPKAAETLRAYWDLVETSLYESHSSTTGQHSRRVAMLDAAMIDLEALTIQLEELREDWGEEEGDRGLVRDALAVLLAGIETGEQLIREARDEETDDGP